MKILIIGAGLAGLSTAYHLENTDYLILEKENGIGGLCRSEVIDGFTFDYAIHILYSKDEYVSKLIKEVLLKDNFNSQIRESWIYSKGIYTEYPFQTHTYGLSVEVIKQCVMGLIEAKYENKSPDKPENFSEWIHKTFGKGIARHFMIPYNKRLWTVEPELMDYNWITERIPMPEIEEVLDGALRPPQKKFGPNAEFWYPEQGGMAALPNGFLPYIKNIELNSEVTNISIEKKEIEVNRRGIMRYDRLVSTLPLPVIIGLLDKAPQAVRDAAADLKFNTIYAVNLGVDRACLSEFHWVYYPENDYIFHRTSFPMNLAKTNAPEGKSSITAEVSCSKYKFVCYDSLIEDTIRDLRKADILKDNDEIVLEDIRTLSPAYVIYDLNHRQNVDLIHGFLKQNRIYACGRFGEWEYLNMDHSILSGKKIAEDIWRA